MFNFDRMDRNKYFNLDGEGKEEDETKFKQFHKFYNL